MAAALITVALAVAFLFACDRIPWLSEKVNAGIEAVVGKRIIYTELPDGTLEVQVIDVGQGDSILIRCPEGNILIDSGTAASEYRLKTHLESMNIEKLDYFICTHPHNDHIGGADMIIREFEVSNLIVNSEEISSVAHDALLTAAEKKDITAHIPKPGETFSVGDASFTVMAPLTEADDENDMSIVLMLSYGDSDFLFMGDAEAFSEDNMLESYGNEVLDCEFLKVGHHGGSTSSGEAFLDAVTPEIAVISCGNHNEYGHPHIETIDRLSQSGCERILRTDKDGTVVIRSDGEVLTVYSPKS